MSDHSSIIPKIRLLAVMEPKTVTGAAKNMLDFCRAARELKEGVPGFIEIETSIVTFERGSTPDRPNEFVAAVRNQGLEADIIAERTRFDPSVIPALRRVVARRAPDIVLTHHVKSHLVMKCSRLWKRFPWVAFHHGYTMTQRRERLYNSMDRLSLPSSRLVVTVCEAFARELSNVAGVPRARIHVQHNSIFTDEAPKPEEGRAFRERLGIRDDERLVLAIGRLSSEKAHIDLLHAFSHLLDANQEIGAQLVIIGDGPERAPLEAAARTLRIASRVHFTGQMSNVRPAYAAADVFVLPSHSEGSPYVLLEAMAANLAIVATSVGGVPEMVGNEREALLVPARDPRAMAEAIARLLTDKDLARALALNASALTASRYSPETYVRSLVKIYQGIIPSAVRPDAQTLPGDSNWRASK
jgi:glycosyltransferase involved in cell wall biosynthesis